MDQHENLIVYHPLCEVARLDQFCETRLYDLEALKLHVKQKHYQCDICRQDKPYMVYKDFPMLRKHFEASHFPCNEPECVEMRVVVFGSEKELEYHRDKVHRKAAVKGKLDAGNLLGVRLHDEEDGDDGYAVGNSRPLRGRGGRGGLASQGRGHGGKETFGKDFGHIVASAD